MRLMQIVQYKQTKKMCKRKGRKKKIAKPRITKLKASELYADWRENNIF